MPRSLHPKGGNLCHQPKVRGFSSPQKSRMDETLSEDITNVLMSKDFGRQKNSSKHMAEYIAAQACCGALEVNMPAESIYSTPGSSLPSLQSQKSSFTWLKGIVLEPSRQVNVPPVPS